MKTRKLLTGEKGWLGLIAYVIAVDSLAWRNQAKGRLDESMSVSWGRWLQFPGSRVATGMAWSMITAHLFLSIPLPGGKTLRKLIIRNMLKEENGEILVIQLIQAES